MKKLLSIVLVVAVLGGFAFVLSYVGKDRAPVAVDTGPHVLVGFSTPDGNYEYKEDAPYYFINVKYPSQTLLTNKTADQKVRLAIEQELKMQLQQFKDDNRLDSLSAEDIQVQGLGGERRYTLQIDYKQYQSTSTVSYFFTVYADTMGAHPNGYFKTFVFDQQGLEVSLGSLLSNNPNWLEELSLLVSSDVVAQLKQRLGQKDVAGAIFAEGLAPKEENFQNFLVDGETLVVHIPPYQVAAYAAGAFEVRVPLNGLSK